MSLFGRQHPATLRDPSFASMISAGDPWNLNFPLFQWSPSNQFLLQHAFENVGVWGEIGCGKTTGTMAFFLTCYLLLLSGGVIHCIKPGDREWIEWLVRVTGRESSLIVVSPQNKCRCNLLRYALKKPGIHGSKVESLVSLLMTIVEAAERGEGSGGASDKFWLRSLRQLLRNGVEICIAARGDITMAMLDAVINSAPRTPEEVHNPDWQKGSLCYQLIEEADAKTRGGREQSDFELAARFFLRSFVELPSDTRGSILATYSVMADVLLRGHMADLFNGETNFTPEVTFGGAIICLDLPTKIYGQAGLIVQTAFGYLWQIAAEQRDVRANPRPLMYVSDEFADVITKKTFSFFSTSRQARVACLVASQNLPNLYAALGGGNAAHEQADAAIASIGTKIFHANGDVTTNRVASEIINDGVQTRMNFHAGREDHRGGGGGGESVGRKVMPSEFTTLKKGGAQNDFITEAIVYQTGASFAANGGEPWQRTAFKQKITGARVKPTR